MPTKSKVVGGWQITKGTRRDDRHGVTISAVRFNGDRVIGLCLGWSRSYLAVFQAPRRSTA